MILGQKDLSNHHNLPATVDQKSERGNQFIWGLI
jgi:hypothetical protein